MIILEIIYLISVILLATYGINALILAGIRKWRHQPIKEILVEKDYSWPQVTVQLPVYNERYVVERLLDAVEKLDYPHDRLYIQVLDDSTDNTKEIVAQSVARLKAKGIDIEQIQRSDRLGYKGGALANGIKYVKGELIAIFDADFVP
ncbi:MAG: glycosyltransferase, partial [Anaerolineales bacterium]|nr:glycosyltransferase [Anaerolineales bacterium]